MKIPGLFQKNSVLFILLAWVLILAVSPGEAKTLGEAAAFDPKAFIVEDGLLFKVEAGNKTQVEGAEVVEEEIESGKIYWLAADPEDGGENAWLYKGWKSGIYFFVSDGKFISCLEREGARKSYVKFSPDGKRFILDSGTYVDREYILYEFAGLEKRKTFYGMTELIWLDSFRFAFTLIDTAKRARYENADIDGWLSVVVYDCAADALTTVAEASKTEDFMLEGVDRESGKLSITKLSVKNEKDWGNENKRESGEISLPIPVAGQTEYKTYLNPRFGYAFEYPDIFSSQREADNGGGIELEGGAGEYSLIIWGGYNVLSEDGPALLRECYGHVAHIVPDSARSGPGFYSLAYSDDGGKGGEEHIFHEYGIVNPDMRAGFVLKYPLKEGKRFAGIAKSMEASLKLPKNK